MSVLLPLKPRLSEKAYGQSKANVYMFVVPMSATKHTVARAVESQFEVSVTDVNMLVLKGKAKRTISQKGRRQLKGATSSMKKAYVTLAEGNKLPIFDAIEEEEAKQEATQEKLTKAMEKQAAKEAKQESKESKPRRGLHLRGKKEGEK